MTPIGVVSGLQHVNESQFVSGGLIVFIKADLIDKPLFKDVVNYERNVFIEL